ncbi:MAG: hypothetical protein IJL33_02435, partial [Ruminococcus sp.]|nr:hypothetical protein [Ruminococcus sp.]
MKHFDDVGGDVHIAPLTFYKYSGLMWASASTHDHLMSLRENGRTLCAPTKKEPLPEQELSDITFSSFCRYYSSFLELLSL